MKIYNQEEREMIGHIVTLLLTVDEAFVHIPLQLDELRLEESKKLFHETIEALELIVASSSPLLIDHGINIVRYITPLGEAIGELLVAYETSNLISIKYILEQRLIPVFCPWKNIVNQLLIPVIAS